MFDNYSKDHISDSIRDFVEELKLQDDSILMTKIVEEVFEAVSYGLQRALWNIENK